MSWATTLAALTGLTVTGVKRTYTYQPQQIGSADLPCLFPALPTGEGSLATFGSATDLRVYRLNLVLVVEPVLQSTPQSKWTSVTTLLDAFATALEGGAVDSYTLRVEETLLGDTPYVAIVAEVEVTA
jgi:hypothetical protein